MILHQEVIRLRSLGATDYLAYGSAGRGATFRKAVARLSGLQLTNILQGGVNGAIDVCPGFWKQVLPRTDEHEQTPCFASATV